MATEEITHLIQDSQSRDPEKQIAAIEKLNDLEAFEAAPTMMQVLSSDPNWKVRSAAIYTLNQLEAVEALPLLIQVLLSDPNRYVRESAAFILKFLGEDQLEIYPISPALLNALDDDEGAVRNEAVMALGYLHSLPATNRLRELLHTDGEWYVRASAAEALARMHDEASLSDVEQAITDPDPQVQRAVILALGQFLDAPTVAPLIAQHLTQKQRDPIVQAELFAISYRLGQLSHLQDVLVMLDQAEDSEVATEILMVLVNLTEENPPADLKNHQAALQTTLQHFLPRHPYLQSDVKRAQDNLIRLESPC